MSISEQEKAELHFMLDYLLMTREGLERVRPDELTPGMQYSSTWSGPRREFSVSGSRFLRRVMGEKLHSAEVSEIRDTELVENTRHGANLATIANAIRSFIPLFIPTTDEIEDPHFILMMVEDFIGIYWGDEPRFFAISSRLQGAHKRPHRLAILRLKALDWEKYLKVAGVSAFERQRIVSNAYRTRWETIRKWSKSVAEQTDFLSWPPANPDWVRESYESDPEKTHRAILSDGDAYWSEKSSAKSG